MPEYKPLNIYDDKGNRLYYDKWSDVYYIKKDDVYIKVYYCSAR